MHADKPVTGIVLMLGFCLIAPMADALAKLLMPLLPLWGLMLVRFAFQAVTLGPVVLFRGLPALAPRVWIMVAARTVLQLTGVALMFLGLFYLPLAEAVAIAYVMPFILLLLGRLVLAEEVGMRRLMAAAVGFAGTMMVVQPSFAEVGWPALLPLGVAVVFAVFMLLTRVVARDVGPVTLQALTGVIGTAMLGVFAIAGLAAGLLPTFPPGLIADHAGLLLALGLAGTLAHLMMSWSLRYAPASTLAPMQYLEIPVAAGLGLAIFGAFPDPLALTGIAVTIAAGLYILHREHAAARRAEV